jgi:hypothetical protein
VVHSAKQYLLTVVTNGGREIERITDLEKALSPISHNSDPASNFSVLRQPHQANAFAPIASTDAGMQIDPRVWQ